MTILTHCIRFYVESNIYKERLQLNAVWLAIKTHAHCPY